jgi:hypothetical protein
MTTMLKLTVDTDTTTTDSVLTIASCNTDTTTTDSVLTIASCNTDKNRPDTPRPHISGFKKGISTLKPLPSKKGISTLKPLPSKKGISTLKPLPLTTPSTPKKDTPHTKSFPANPPNTPVKTISTPNTHIEPKKPHMSWADIYTKIDKIESLIDIQIQAKIQATHQSSQHQVRNCSLTKCKEPAQNNTNFCSVSHYRESRKTFTQSDNKWVKGTMHECYNKVCTTSTKFQYCPACFNAYKNEYHPCTTQDCKSSTRHKYCHTCYNNMNLTVCGNQYCTNTGRFTYCDSCYSTHKRGEYPTHECNNAECNNQTSKIHLKYCDECYTTFMNNKPTYDGEYDGEYDEGDGYAKVVITLPKN